MTDQAEQRLSPVKRALLELREMRVRLEAVEGRQTEPVAIIGMGLRFPGASDPDGYWRLLREGRDAVTEVPPDRWDLNAFYAPDPDTPGKMYARHGAFVDGVDLFEPQFFGISPREAVSMDPQQRLLLEVAWEALEDSAQAPDRLLESATGVYLGMGGSDYSRMVVADPLRVDAYAASGSSFSVAAGRLSYLLGLQGPSLAVDTACSASLVALHLAVRSLRSGEIRMALAGGVSLILSPEAHINFCQARMLAPDGRCKTFDARADGYVRGEGCGIVVLKRLSDARADGDRVLALIRGTAVNQDGRSNGLTAPNGRSQVAVIRAALRDGGVAPSEVDYVEAHGTGTSLGDPIELNALAAALGDGRVPGSPLLVGSVKTNIGHLEAAAGIAGLLKVVLALQHEEIPPHLHFDEPNPYVDWSAPLRVTRERTPWTEGSKRRLAGVSSFGFSGTNAHVVVEEAPDEPAGRDAATAADTRDTPERPRHLFVLSATSESALRSLAGRHAAALSSPTAAALPDVCFTASTGRAHLPRRLAIVAESAGEVRSRLEAVARGETPRDVLVGATSTARLEVGFLFTGQGSQYAGMGRQLFESQPTFRRALEECEALVRPHLERSLFDALFPADGEGAGLIDQTAYTQPALFALEWSLLGLWRSWGVEPAAVLGHSVGEYVAACAADVLGLADGLRLIAQRARLMQALPAGGAMAAVFASPDRVRERLAPHAANVSVAAVNGPENVVISGARDTVAAVRESLLTEGMKSRDLTVSHAFHSPLMDPILDELEAAAHAVPHHDPSIDLISNLTGRPVRPGEMGGQYWRRHAREAVQFAASMQTLESQRIGVFLEIGPNPILGGMAERCVGSGVFLASLRKGREDWRQILESLGALYVRGARVDWPAFDRPYPRRRVALPTYPFERQRFWIDASAGAPATPPYEAALTAARAQSHQGPLDFSVGTYPAKFRLLERLSGAYQVSTLRHFGVFAKGGERHEVGELRERMGIAPTYQHLLSRWLDGLVGDGVLVREGEAFVAPAPLSEPPIDALHAEADALFADYPELIGYVRRCGERLVRVLSGGENALETLFPEGSFDVAEGIYERSAVARYGNGIARAAVAGVVSALPPTGVLKVIEVGAGTGGTTGAVLSALPPDRTAYDFTDMSDLFFARAAKKFAAFPFVRFSRLDIERDPVPQGYSAGSYHLAVAANVLHATRDLRGTIERVRSLLGPGGVLLLVETTTHPRYFDVTTGLIEGWQVFQDDLRTDNPLIGAPTWVDVLRAAGFEAASFLPEAGSPADILGNHVILAAVPGRVALSSARVGEASGATRSAESAGASPSAPALREDLRGSLAEDRLETLVDFVRREVMEVLRLDAGHAPDRRARLIDLGLDSLMAVQLRNQLATGLGLTRKLSATLVFDHPTCEAVAAYLDGEVAAEDGVTSSEPEPTRARSGDVLPSLQGVAGSLVASAVVEASEEEAEALLLKKLESIEGRRP